MRELSPDFVDADFGYSYAKLGRQEEARRELSAFLEQAMPQVWEASERGWAQGGHEGGTRAVLEIVTDIEGFSPFVIAVWYAILGETD